MSLRDKFFGTLSAIKPIDNVEKQAIDDAISWIKNGGSLYRRPGKNPSPEDRHLVCYFPLIDFEKESVFLGFHAKAQLWIPPGGHIDEGETPVETVIRECGEELQIPARFIEPRPLFISSMFTRNIEYPHVDIAFWFVLISRTDENIVIDSNEFEEARWFSVDESLPYDREPNLERFISKLKQTDTHGFNARSRDLARRVMLPSLMPS
jgi:8-oxo-dGTP diphosphatase